MVALHDESLNPRPKKGRRAPGRYTSCWIQLNVVTNSSGSAGGSLKMKGFTLMAASTLAVLMALGAGGCASPEHRMNTAASRDDTRRADFEHCRAEGRSDCDAILNAPVNSNTPREDSVREQERREAYNRCVDRGGTNCDDLLRHDHP